MSYLSPKMQALLEESAKKIQEHPEIVEQYKQEHPDPKCPTCGSPKLRHISGTEKVVSTMALGFFSNKRRQQFECLNCGYKW